MSEAPYPPADQPAEGDRAAQGSPPRYHASASVPVPGTTPQPDPGHQGQGPQPGQAYPHSGPPPAGGRFSASASVPMPPPPFGQQTPSTPPAPSAAPPAPPAYGPPQSFGGQVYQPPLPPPQFGGQPPAPAPVGPPPGYGVSPNVSHGMGQGIPGPMGQGYPPGYGQPAEPARPRENLGVPTGGWPYVETPPEPPRKSRRGLIVALIAAAVLVVVGVGGYVGWSLTNRTSQFTVGTCVKQDGTGAAVVNCDATGAYRIVSVVTTEDGCPDPTQPSLVLTEFGGSRKYACLAPASG